MDMKKLCAALGLPDTATEADVMASIEALKGKAAPPDNPPAFASMKSKVTALEAENTELKGKVATFAAAQGKAEHEKRVAGYLATAKEFKAVPGTPEELATQLTDLEEKSGKPAADLALAAFKKAEELAVAVGVLKPKGSSKDGKPSTDFDSAVVKYQKDNPTADRAVAIKAVSAANPDLWNTRNK